ncbi:hypothetical protein [Rhizobium sp. FKY42]|uniref:hypothetical protein n=1 Tax=Rhizobium sp. FKY42 TaxID=2562310 RepID=UPI0010C13847|nr:hypothetical protein [Rhizobium sp. FKY42]
MKLSYNVLCIDDQLASLSRNKTLFRQLNDSVGIDVVYRDINAAASPEETEKAGYLARLKGEIDRAYAEATFDLILIDLHLHNEVEGHELIEFIRDKHSIYRPVIFYSAGENPRSEKRAKEQLDEAATKSGVHGKNVLLTPRQGIDDLLADIATEMHKEEHKINQVRGLLMDRVSELEANIIKVLASDSGWDALGEQGQANLLVYIRKSLLKKRYDDAKKQHDAMIGMDIGQIRQRLRETPQTFDSYNRARLLKSMLEFIGGMDDQVAAMQTFIEKGGLNGIRNDYAHKTAAELDVTHNDERCIEIRRGAREQLVNIGKVLAVLDIS